VAEHPKLLDQVYERDLDPVLLSGLYCSDPFRNFVPRSVSNWTGSHRLVRARVSEMTDAGETDVLMVVDLEGADRLAIMLEDKIGAGFQSVQADRYRQRGQEGIRDGQWDRFLACLCAPEDYITAARPSNEWDAYLALEAIIQWIERSSGDDYAFIAAVCSQVIAKRSARVNEKSREATAFWEAYRQLANEVLPDVGITRLPALVGKASPWPRFVHGEIPSHFLLEHKPQQGRVDLTFDKYPQNELRSYLTKPLPFDIQLVKAGGSSALRIVVPRVDHLRSFGEQKNEVLVVYAAVNRLLVVAREVSVPVRYVT
jgi:hypothetical protein